jgi:uncharacterized protein (TIGR02599 family)
MKPRAALPPDAGFTMVELLAATAILSLIMVLTLQITSNTNTIWQRARSRIDTFQESRAAFEAMTRNLSQAMLNPYWDYVDAAGKPRDPALASFVPSQYVRQSELHFVSGPSKDVLKSVNGSNGQPLKSATHSVFFQAPLGVSQPATTGSTTTLPALLNVSGYFLEFGDDAKFRPRFLEGSERAPLRNRFRLMEMSQPSESLSVYQWVSQASKAAVPTVATLSKWFVEPLNEDTLATTASGPTSARRVKRSLAENIVALIILPKRSTNDGPTDAKELAPNYAYDSRAYQTAAGNELAKLTRNQLPPLVQVTMVAIDETSAARLESRADSPSTPPDLGLADLFKTSAKGVQLAADLATLEKTLNDDAHRVTYRIFSTDVSILQAKWSEN